ncbi:pilus assembly protein PilB [Nocardioides baekrokdamisoli]|uniref:Pilus assembly protein PilB n=1 Tax=Nocardioides baekrokdamisoli TaxID=1804624 RepID=A0A3G9IV43_9ACTN|nr:GspE/PulE family protein [Nocardioides baekrokdamisoli]BBH16123.1 pilus assembly protein PilB [Nocardioides baekrokdamisoli]
MFKRRRSDPTPVTNEAAEADRRLGDLLVRQGLISSELLEQELLIESAKPLDERLVARHAVDEESLAAVLAKEFDASRQDFRTISPEPDATALLTVRRARTLRAVPLFLKDDGVVVAVVDPAPEHIAMISEAVGRPVTAVVGTQRDLEYALDISYRATQEVNSQVHEFEVADALRRETARMQNLEVNEDAPVVKVVQSIITQALRDRASDIHIEPSGERVRVRYRIDGALSDILDLPTSIGPGLVSRVKILANMNIVERRRPQDGQISTTIEGREVDIRVSAAPVVGGEKVVMRVLDKSRPLYDLPKLGMPGDMADRFRMLLHSPYGMVICAGPTGAGKTTTLYASLGELNSPERNLMTIEDPVEYTFDSINQIQINEQAGVTFANGLRSILRQDPDVILVGEVRDVETARIAVQSALTGHFVLSSLHATEAVSAVHRLLDMGIEPFLIASSVTAVVAQRLMRRSCRSCLESYTPTPEEMTFLESFGGREPARGFERGTGCNFCAHTGYMDRVGVYELLPVSQPIRDLILDRAPHDKMREVARAEGMRTLQEQAIRLVESGVTTAAEVMRTIYMVAV